MEEQVAQYTARGQSEPLPPPVDDRGVLGRLRSSFFATPVDAVLTVAFAMLALWIAWAVLNWAVLNAVFVGEDRTACLAEGGGHIGACWAFVGARFSQFIYGLYPVAERWRVDVVFVLFALLLIPIAIPQVGFKRLNAMLLLLALPLVSLVLLTGGRFSISGGTTALAFLAAAGATVFAAFGKSSAVADLRTTKISIWLLAASALLILANGIVSSDRVDFLSLRFSLLSFAAFAAAVLAALLTIVALARTAETKSAVLTLFVPLLFAGAFIAILTTNFSLPAVPTRLWGGLLVTLVVAVVGIAASLPLGILLALGRQSQMPAVRLFSIIFIEFWRGVPLITVLFMANFMLPLFLPSGVTLNTLLRVLVGVSLFAAAYMAEVVRGGLQAIPRGQYEGADAMGLTYWQKMRMIILPQALTLVIPGIVNTFIGLFKDTSLVYIIGLADLLGTVRRGFSDPNWITPSTPATGLIFAGFIFWLFCFSMSRYSIFMERRLAKGHRR